MNINELTSSLYGANVRNINSNAYISKALGKSEHSEGTSEKFSDILSSFALSGDVDELTDSIKEIENGLDDENADSSAINKSNVMNILTDAEIAKEYLESKSGRNLIVSMAQNTIASIIAGNNGGDNNE